MSGSPDCSTGSGSTANWFGIHAANGLWRTISVATAFSDTLMAERVAAAPLAFLFMNDTVMAVAGFICHGTLVNFVELPRPYCDVVVERPWSE